LNNSNILDVYYGYLNNFFNYFSQAVNPKVLDLHNREVYDFSSYQEDLIYPVGTRNLPLSLEQKADLAIKHAGRPILFQFFAEDTNLYGGVSPEGKNIPNLGEVCDSVLTGKFRLFRCMNCFFSTKIAAKEHRFNWEYIVIPCGHNSNFANQYLPMINLVDPTLWTNPRFYPEFFYFISPELFNEPSV